MNKLLQLEEENRRLKLKLDKDIQRYFCERISSLEKRVEILERYKESQREERKRQLYWKS